MVGVAGGITFIFATRCLPPVVLALPLYVMARSTGAYDSILGLVLVYSAINLPVAVWLLQLVIGSRVRKKRKPPSLTVLHMWQSSSKFSFR